MSKESFLESHRVCPDNYLGTSLQNNYSFILEPGAAEELRQLGYIPIYICDRHNCHLCHEEDCGYTSHYDHAMFKDCYQEFVLLHDNTIWELPYFLFDI